MLDHWLCRSLDGFLPPVLTVLCNSLLSLCFPWRGEGPGAGSSLGTPVLSRSPHSGLITLPCRVCPRCLGSTVGRGGWRTQLPAGAWLLSPEGEELSSSLRDPERCEGKHSPPPPPRLQGCPGLSPPGSLTPSRGPRPLSWNVLVPCAGMGAWDGDAWGLCGSQAVEAGSGLAATGPWCPCDGPRVGGSVSQWGPPPRPLRGARGCPSPAVASRVPLGGQCPRPAHSWRGHE